MKWILRFFIIWIYQNHLKYIKLILYCPKHDLKKTFSRTIQEIQMKIWRRPVSFIFLLYWVRLDQATLNTVRFSPGSALPPLQHHVYSENSSLRWRFRPAQPALQACPIGEQIGGPIRCTLLRGAVLSWLRWAIRGIHGLHWRRRRPLSNSSPHLLYRRLRCRRSQSPLHCFQKLRQFRLQNGRL